MDLKNKVETFFNAAKKGYKNPDWSRADAAGFDYRYMYENGFATGQRLYYGSRISLILFLATLLHLFFGAL